MSNMSITRYEAYKDSGVEWLGEVPAHWGLQRFKDFADILSGYSPEEVKPDLQGNMAYYKVDDLNSLSETSHITQSTWYVNSTKCVYKKNILLLPKRGMSILTNKVGITNINCIFDTNLMGLRLSSKYVDIKFIFYWTINVGLSKLADITTIPQLNNKHIYPIVIYLPTRKEQAAIANYLDTKTAQIDRKLDLLSQKATQYGKLKQSLINETVTRGLDKTVPMKDSGIEWIGEVPAHWNLCRLKELSTIQNSNVDKKSHDNEIPVQLCNYVDVYKNDFIDASLNFMWASADESEIKRFTIKENDVLITKDSETCDDIAIPALATESIEGVLCGYHLAQFRVKDKVLSGAYLFRLFQSKSYGFRFVISAKGITRVGLGQSAIADSLTPVPPLQEQQAIATYLDEKTAHIDRIIATINTQIDKLKELRKALINDVVTGKIKVA